MKPTKIYRTYPKRVKYGRKLIYVTDDGEYTTQQMHEYVGITRQGWAARVRRYGHKSEKLLLPRSNAGPIDNQWGTTRWHSLGSEPRCSVDDIQVGAFELDLPDPYDEQKVKQYDREYFV